MCRILSVEVCSLNDIMLLSVKVSIYRTYNHGKYNRFLLPVDLRIGYES